MYKCENCNQQMPAKTPSQLFPIETRKKTYPPRFINLKHARGKSERHTDKKHFDEGGTGFETVREIRVCPSCAAQLTQEHKGRDCFSKSPSPTSAAA